MNLENKDLHFLHGNAVCVLFLFTCKDTSTSVMLQYLSSIMCQACLYELAEPLFFLCLIQVSVHFCWIGLRKANGIREAACL